MFIKKDTRKIPQILTEATARLTAPPEHSNDVNNNDDDHQPVTELSFARRAPELLSSGISLILQPRHHPALQHLVQLSLYDCGLTSLTDISLSDTNKDDTILFPKLEQLDIGRNPKLINDSLSDTFHTQLPLLTEIWADNCSFGPSIPETLLQLNFMEVCRLTGNQLHSPLPSLHTYWPQIKVLAFDGNQLSSVKGLEELRYLEKLHLRQNDLTEVEGVPSASNPNLIMIGLSSNKLRRIPQSLLESVSLKEVYLNSNELTDLPHGLATKLVELNKLNLAHNKIGHQQQSDEEEEDATTADKNALPADFVERFGLPDAISGKCEKDDTCVVHMDGNPLSESRKKRHLDEEKRRAKEMALMKVDNE